MLLFHPVRCMRKVGKYLLNFVIKVWLFDQSCLRGISRTLMNEINKVWKFKPGSFDTELSHEHLSVSTLDGRKISRTVPNPGREISKR